MQEVHIAYEPIDYEGAGILGFFDTREAAERCVAESNFAKTAKVGSYPVNVKLEELLWL